MMSEFKGTKGEWVIKKKAPIGGDVHLLFADVNSKGEGYLVGGVCVWDDDKDSAQEAACNAHLIAAAPDLLRALQKVVGYCESPEWRGAMTAKQMATFMDGVRAELLPVIAKALGETK